LITLDTSALFALLNRRDPDHRRVRACVDADGGPYLIPAAILGELSYLVEARLGQRVMDAFLDDVISGGFVVDCGENELPRVKSLAVKYADLPLGFCDAAVAVCAHLHGKRIATLDVRDFSIVGKELHLEVLPK
jgi:predicted nucleic acid-binding protein